MSPLSTAILIPCYNESATIKNVIQDFKQLLPDAMIYVYDNDSSDGTARIAEETGAVVRHVKLRGKGQVVRRMFADIQADCYVMVDGDATYDAKVAPLAIKKLVDEHLDMVVCTRTSSEESAYRLGHATGNKWFTKIVHFLFGKQFTDIFSGFRVFSKRFVKSFPITTHGFEIEAEITIHALQLGVPSAEIPSFYLPRPPGSASKLKTIRDGFKILRTILLLFLYIRPMSCFGGLFIFFASLSLILGTPVVMNFIHTGLVTRLPSAVLAASLGLLASLALVSGMILDSISRTRLETKRFWYLLAATIK